MKRKMAGMSLLIVAAVALLVRAQDLVLEPSDAPSQAAKPAADLPSASTRGEPQSDKVSAESPNAAEEEVILGPPPESGTTVPRSWAELAARRGRGTPSTVFIQADGSIEFQDHASRQPRRIAIEDLKDLLSGRKRFRLTVVNDAPWAKVQHVVQVLQSKGAAVELHNSVAADNPFPFASPSGTAPAPARRAATLYTQSPNSGTPMLNRPDVPVYQFNPGGPGPRPHLITPEDPAIAGLRRNWQILEENTEQLARQLQEKLRDVSDPAEAARIRAEIEPTIKEQVGFAFKARQELLGTELTNFERRLKKLSTRYQDREREQQAIIDRRVAELLNPNARWDVDQPLSATVPGVADATPAAERPMHMSDERFDRYAASLFKQYDENNDGVLQKDEWSKMGGTPKRIDKNNDELISKPEILEALAEDFTQRPKPAIPLHLFSPYRPADRPIEDPTSAIRLHVHSPTPPSRPPFEDLMPDLGGFGLRSTEQDFHQRIKEGRLADLLSVTETAEGLRSYTLPLGEGARLILMFQNGVCTGIQTLPAEQTEKGPDGTVPGGATIEQPVPIELPVPTLPELIPPAPVTPTLPDPRLEATEPAEPSADVKRWQGRWRVGLVKEKDGSHTGPRDRELVELVVNGDELRITRADQADRDEPETARLELDATTSPASFLWRGGAFGPGIYEFTHERELVIAMPNALKGASRPDSFDTSQDGNRRVYILNRVTRDAGLEPAAAAPK